MVQSTEEGAVEDTRSAGAKLLAEINERQAAREKAWEDPTEGEDD